MLIRALLIEDSPEFAELVRLWLARRKESISFELHREETLAGAMAYLTTARVDLIFTDLGLPDSDGLPTLTKLVAVAPESPIIVLSGEDGDGLMSQMIFYGAEDHIVKADCKADTLITASLYALARHFEGQTKRGRSPLLEVPRTAAIEADRAPLLS